ncbi:phosphopantetheine adenylyltransferase [Endomicrobiia bacterium]|uniref:Phosphopantetheine adenylyltransferase n=1 Tax=uncultured Termite group 1 bacterium TaxID=167965 RepID=B1B5B5_9BACT|nr:pantetheine-phosphate adenylyltransferase [uncultured Termite group 1 bacterium]GHT04221.1 phosphopantetheine adenylyltransferase [Endomicrobiia bacterium]GHT10805.1 phosphopantetheine adenylyltransferase [Endomicrobiia bacterium]GHT20775.1 phosphopantetheine adenylyltransferase [Endomicrobiia bacterium]GHT25959.1 phosphopantetheine adenylyltransferase [Endomicrobiia bacterium]
MTKGILAVYPGSFDPPTNGHLDIIIRASHLFPKIIIAVTKSINKKHIFSLQERINLLQKIIKNLKNVKVASFSGLLANYLAKINSFVLIRGLRALSDFEYEFQMALMNRNLNKKIETVFLMPDQSYTFLSSGMVREIAMLGGDTKDFVPECVKIELKKRSLDLSKDNFIE